MPELADSLATSCVQPRQSERKRQGDDVLLDEPLLKAAEIARLLAVPTSTVYEYARRAADPLPSLTLGRHRRFVRAHVEEWLRVRSYEAHG